MKRLIGSAIFLLASAGAGAGPFGLDGGTPLAELRTQMNLKAGGPFWWSTSKTPNSHPDFDDYRLAVTPVHGLCKINAWISDVTTSVYGTELRSRFEALEAALNSKYGPSKKFNHLKAGSIWDEPKDWTMALMKQERVLRAYWLAEGREFPDNLQAIALSAVGVKQNTAMISISTNSRTRMTAWTGSRHRRTVLSDI